jgi:hypothetical protein
MKCTEVSKEEKGLMNKREARHKDLKDLWNSKKNSASKSSSTLQGSQIYIKEKSESTKLHLGSFLYLCSILLCNRILHNVYFKEGQFGISLRTTYKALKICHFEFNVETDQHFKSNTFQELIYTSYLR